MKLQASTVQYIYERCLLDEGNMADSVLVDGIVTRSVFHKGRLEEHKAHIMELLLELPDTFRDNVGGGWSFLNGCIDNAERQWAEQPTVDMLFQLGIATGQGAYLMPREFWKLLPGGVPYYVVKVG